MKTWCWVCNQFMGKIRTDGRIRRHALKDVENYTEGSMFVTKHSITCHLLIHLLKLFFDHFDQPGQERGSLSARRGDSQTHWPVFAVCTDAM